MYILSPLVYATGVDSSLTEDGYTYDIEGSQILKESSSCMNLLHESAFYFFGDIPKWR